MKLIEEQGLRILYPEEGYVLNQGDIYSKVVYLSIFDSPSEWKEIPAEEAIIDE